LPLQNIDELDIMKHLKNLKKQLNSLRNWLLLDFTRLRQLTLLFQLRGTLNLVKAKTKYQN